MADADALAEKTRDWLIKNPREVFEPIPFFESVWSKSKIVTFGERHDDAGQRALVAAVVKQVGGADVGLALEIEAKYQDDIARFIKGGGKTPVRNSPRRRSTARFSEPRTIPRPRSSPWTQTRARWNRAN